MRIQLLDKEPSNYKQFIAFVPQNATVQLPIHDLNIAAAEANAAEMFTGKQDEIVPLVKGNSVVILVGLGEDPKSLSARKLGQLTKMALQTQPLSTKRPVVILPHEDTESVIRSIIDGAKLGLYKWDKYINTESKDEEPDFDLFIQSNNPQWIQTYSLIADGVNFARDLGNENAGVCTTDFLADSILEVINNHPQCSVEILDRTKLEEYDLGLHLAVAQGSIQEPKLVIVKYQGADESEPYHALIGKGITYDTGGLNLKPTGSIESMRMDMCGAAAVCGTLRNTLALDLPCNMLFVFGLAENAIGPKSYKPGDVFLSYCGKTVEIGNTDAEGRLVLADANSYIARNYKPEAIINIATLTGAVIFALGYEYSGLMYSDEQLGTALEEAAKVSDDRAWPLPIFAELGEHVKSQIADIKNSGLPRCAGTISAGEFLRQFAQCDSTALKWAHLDIAGTAKPKNDVGYFPSLATGAGVRLLTQYLRTRAGR